MHGGIGLHTVGSAYVAGAAGVMLDAQLLLARESPADAALRAAGSGLDGSETEVLGRALGAPFRLYSRPGMEGPGRLRAAELASAAAAAAGRDWRETVVAHVAGAEGPPVYPIGQDAALAADLARRFGTVAGILDGLRDALARDLRHRQRSQPPGRGSRRGG